MSRLMKSAFEIPGYADLFNFLVQSVDQDMLEAAHDALCNQSLIAAFEKAPKEVQDVLAHQRRLALVELVNYIPKA